MKKFVVILSIIIAVAVVAFIAINVSNNNSEEETVEFGGTYLNSIYNSVPDSIAIYDIESIMSEELALEIGNAVIKSICREEAFQRLNITYVSTLKNKDVYVVTKAQKWHDGGGYSVSISKIDGSILRVWIEE